MDHRYSIYKYNYVSRLKWLNYLSTIEAVKVKRVLIDSNYLI